MLLSRPRPTSCKEMSSFLGFTGYYHGFIPKYSALMNRMNSMKKAEKFDWSEDMERDFLELKAEFAAGRIQAYPDFDSSEPFILTTDWSALNIAGVLSQKQEGVEQLLACWGRKCNRYKIAQFEFIVIHKKENENVNADALSRA